MADCYVISRCRLSPNLREYRAACHVHPYLITHAVSAADGGRMSAGGPDVLCEFIIKLRMTVHTDTHADTQLAP